MNNFSFIQTRPEAGDCTAPYDIHFYKQMTVEEFVNDVLQRNEWGTIYIYDPDNPDNWYRRKECCVYSGSILKRRFPDNILNRAIKSASSHGGWSLMDYTLVLE